MAIRREKKSLVRELESNALAAMRVPEANKLAPSVPVIPTGIAELHQQQHGSSAASAVQRRPGVQQGRRCGYRVIPLIFFLPVPLYSREYNTRNTYRSTTNQGYYVVCIPSLKKFVPHGKSYSETVLNRLSTYKNAYAPREHATEETLV